MNAKYETDFLFSVEHIQYRLSCAINAAEAVHTAMEEGSFAPESYLDGMFAVLEHLGNLNQDLKNSVDACFEERRRSKEERHE